MIFSFRLYTLISILHTKKYIIENGTLTTDGYLLVNVIERIIRYVMVSILWNKFYKNKSGIILINFHILW